MCRMPTSCARMHLAWSSVNLRVSQPQRPRQNRDWSTGGGRFTSGGVTRFHIGNPKFSIGRLGIGSFSTTLGPPRVIKLRPNPVGYHFLCFITRSSPRSERSATRGGGESCEWTPDHPLVSVKKDSDKNRIGGGLRPSPPKKAPPFCCVWKEAGDAHGSSWPPRKSSLRLHGQTFLPMVANRSDLLNQSKHM